MKKTYVLVVLSLLVTVLFGCASQQQIAQASTAQVPDVPDWFINEPEYEGVICGVGVAKMENTSKSKTAAEGRARVAIARTISAKVKASLIDLQKEGGLDGSTATTDYFEDIARTLTEADMSGAIIKSRYVAKDGTIYALAIYNIADAGNLFKRQASTSARKNAAYAQFQAEDALAKMEAAFEKSYAATEKVTTD